MNTTSAESRFLAALRDLLRDKAGNTIYPCIQDLVEHGLDRARFAASEVPPLRQDVTQYLAAWSRHAGLSEEESRAWLVEFCATVLAPLSRRTPAAIRHSTQSNLRYIYRSSVPFLCDCADNRFRAACRTDCPVHADMQVKKAARAEEAAKPKPLVRYERPVVTFVPPVMVANREQFEQALSLVREEIQKGTKPKRIIELLAKRGLKTRTGRKWTATILYSELTKLKASDAAPPPGEPGASPR